MGNKDKNLYRLDELSDYKVASNYSDVTGWKIVDADNRTIGKIDNLWVNKDMQRVVYLDVNVDKALIEDSKKEVHDAIEYDNGKEFMYTEGDTHIIIPIGSVSINKDTKIVMANGIGYDTFRKTSRYNRLHNFDRDYERNVLRSYYPADESGFNSNSDDDTFYNRREFDGR
ncbi:PRC-barrel domain-containing protein [Flavobacterium quisquiliarum]|uniref:PRC-barrel domain-containing protein n=1 Tax=Flavobacterium quisquiliarum TaxID=1834436 RepID=A0ABV8W3P0_9FLAO|nr:PRC-barrel domain-containing protein [Flavobacterium quisquiliarum]MBW1654592.1 photosystem reaction center subunit H [Flavobacterium quisquiliarum]NWL01722.1 photosystem reaction center subunit H [Flavobacterium collinsii]